MPLVNIHLISGSFGPEQIKKIADTIHQVMVAHFSTPKHDRYQIITQHEPWEMMIEDSGLGYKRSPQLVVIQITQQGRTRGQKQVLYLELTNKLGKECLIQPHDLVITLNENLTEDWSFGDGRAQYLDGGLESVQN